MVIFNFNYDCGSMVWSVSRGEGESSLNSCDI